MKKVGELCGIPLYVDDSLKSDEVLLVKLADIAHIPACNKCGMRHQWPTLTCPYSNGPLPWTKKAD